MNLRHCPSRGEPRKGVPECVKRSCDAKHCPSSTRPKACYLGCSVIPSSMHTYIASSLRFSLSRHASCIAQAACARGRAAWDATSHHDNNYSEQDATSGRHRPCKKTSSTFQRQLTICKRPCALLLYCAGLPRLRREASASTSSR